MGVNFKKDTLWNILGKPVKNRDSATDMALYGLRAKLDQRTVRIALD